MAKAFPRPQGLNGTWCVDTTSEEGRKGSILLWKLLWRRRDGLALPGVTPRRCFFSAVCGDHVLQRHHNARVTVVWAWVWLVCGEGWRNEGCCDLIVVKRGVSLRYPAHPTPPVCSSSPAPPSPATTASIGSVGCCALGRHGGQPDGEAHVGSSTSPSDDPQSKPPACPSPIPPAAWRLASTSPWPCESCAYPPLQSDPV